MCLNRLDPPGLPLCNALQGVQTHDFRAAPYHGTDPQELALTSAAFTVKDSPGPCFRLCRPWFGCKIWSESMTCAPLSLTPGALRTALDLFEKFEVNLTHLESRPAAQPSVPLGAPPSTLAPASAPRT